MNKLRLLRVVFWDTDEDLEQYLPNVDAALSKLTDREQYVLRQRFSDSGITLREIGAVLGVQKERVRQIEAKALRKLCHPSRRRILKGVGREEG